MSELSEAINEMRNMRESYDQLGAAAEAYNTGKVQLAENITAKGVEASATETLPELAEKVMAISQQPIILSPSEVGDMYAMQQFGALTTPNYWNLYEVLNTLLNNTNPSEFGGILIGQYYKGYDSIEIGGTGGAPSAGTGGGYVYSDEFSVAPDGTVSFQIHRIDEVHYWNDDGDGKGDRWVAWLFAGEDHGYSISSANTCPRKIFIGRKVGVISSVVNGRVSEIVVPDGNTLGGFNTGTYTQNWNKHVVIRNINQSSGTLIYDPNSTIESIYILGKNITGGPLFRYNETSNTISSIIIEAEESFLVQHIIQAAKAFPSLALKELIIKAPTINASNAPYSSYATIDQLKNLTIISEQCYLILQTYYGNAMPATGKIHLKYIENLKTKGVTIAYAGVANVQTLVLQEDWNKPLNIAACTGLLEENIYTYILQRLKQDEADCGSGVTITLGSTNLNKLTSQESQDLLAELRGTYGYTFA